MPTPFLKFWIHNNDSCIGKISFLKINVCWSRFIIIYLNVLSTWKIIIATTFYVWVYIFDWYKCFQRSHFYSFSLKKWNRLKNFDVVLSLKIIFKNLGKKVKKAKLNSKESSIINAIFQHKWFVNPLPFMYRFVEIIWRLFPFP